MREPGFWWRPSGAEAALLQPFAAIYGTVAAARMRRAGQRVGIPVLCVGNLTLGGAGKTPTALAVGKLLAEAGARPFFLTRGYGGRLRGPVTVDPGRHNALDVGDEPLLLARIATTVVARDRVAGAEAAVGAGAGVVVMDDGFQSPWLAKDLSILVVDGERGIGNGRVFPAGPLRAPLAEQIARAQAVVAIGGSDAGLEPVAAARARGIPVLTARLAPDPAGLAALAGRPVLAFAGIAHPDKFYATLVEAGIDVRAKRSFADHHSYSYVDARSLLAEASAWGLTLATTEKDLVRLAGRLDLAELAARTRALPVTLMVDDADGFAGLVRRAAGRA